MGLMARVPTTLPMSKDWLSTGQASRLANVSSQHLRDLMKAGKLPYVATAAGYMVRREDIEDYARQRAEQPTHHYVRSRIA